MRRELRFISASVVRKKQYTLSLACAGLGQEQHKSWVKSKKQQQQNPN